jgi:Glu-tRNA(Gln) amidotransferase subunit E-like FAD-binding protein
MPDIKLKIGVEIHQQLDTHKLFCKCASELRSDEPDVKVKRRLYAVAGEEGKIDIAAAYEESKKREYIYEAYSDSNCLVELDEEPPHKINQEALKIAIQISLLLNAKILPVSQVMRKTVVDGSNTSGFQRTMLLAKNGFLEIGNKKIGIQSICLEEDAARRTAETKESVTFRLDRLGIPLIEIATAPEISSGEEAKEVALKIGEILRACKVKHGIGTIRQDVNLSINNGNRVEIKGVQEPSLIKKTVEAETKRQLELEKKKKKWLPEVRNALPDGNTKFLRPLPGASRMYPETDLPLIKISEEMIEKIAKDLPRLKTDIVSELAEEGVSEEYAKIIVDEKKMDEFDELMETNIDANIIAKLLVLYPKEVSSHENISLKEVEEKSRPYNRLILEAMHEKKITESSIKDIIAELAKGSAFEEILRKSKTAGKSDIEGEIKKIMKEKPGLSAGAYMGLLMQKFKGKVNGKELMEMLKKKLK